MRPTRRILQRCVRAFRTVNFADQQSGRIYLSIESGVPAFRDGALLLIALSDPETYAGIEAVAPSPARSRVISRATLARPRGDRSSWLMAARSSR